MGWSASLTKPCQELLSAGLPHGNGPWRETAIASQPLGIVLTYLLLETLLRAHWWDRWRPVLVNETEEEGDTPATQMVRMAWRPPIPLLIACQYLLFKLLAFGSITGSTSASMHQARISLVLLSTPDSFHLPIAKSQHPGGCHQTHRFSFNCSYHTNRVRSF